MDPVDIRPVVQHLYDEKLQKGTAGIRITSTGKYKRIREKATGNILIKGLPTTTCQVCGVPNADSMRQ
jgi:hypothetical protein